MSVSVREARTGPGKSWEFKVQIFQAWKVMHSCLGAVKSWKKLNDCHIFDLTQYMFLVT